ANVFEVARATAGQVERVVYASSEAVFGAPSLYPLGPIKDDAPPRPATHYGVYKVANEETARIYWEEHRIRSAGFPPLTVSGPGRDCGLTADPTLAMKAAILGRPFQIRWGGSTDLIYTEDVARAFLAAAAARLDGARVYNLHGASASVADVVRAVEAAWPPAQELHTHVDPPRPRWTTHDIKRIWVSRRPPRSPWVSRKRSTSSNTRRRAGGSTLGSSHDGLPPAARVGRRRRADLPDLQPGHRGPRRHAGGRASHARRAPRVAREPKPAPPRDRRRARRGRDRRLGEPQRVQPARGLPLRPPPLRVPRPE